MEFAYLIMLFFSFFLSFKCLFLNYILPPVIFKIQATPEIRFILLWR